MFTSLRSRIGDNRPGFVIVILLCLALRVEAQTEPLTTDASFDDFATTLITTKSPTERESLLSQKKGLMTPALRKALIRQGNVHLMAGQYATAFDIYGLARNIAEKIGDKEGVASASLDIGTVYYFQANYPAALEHYLKARELFTEVTNNYESAKALSGLALIYTEQRRDAEALTALQQALKEFTELGDKEEIANTLSSIGTIYYGQGKYADAAEAFKKSTDANSNPDNLVRVADALYMQGDYARALGYYKQSLAELPQQQNPGGVIAALNGAANSAYYQGNYTEALQYYERNALLQQNQPDKAGLVAALRGIGNVHRSRGDYAAALENYFKSLNISQQTNAPTGSILGSIGLVRAFQGDYERALDYYGKAQIEFAASANKIELARVLSLIGNAYYAQRNYEPALEAYRQAFGLRVEMDDKSGQGDLLSGMGSVFLRQKRYLESLDSYKKALALFDSVANKQRMADVLTRVADTFLLQGEFAKALSAAESAMAVATVGDNSDIRWYAQLQIGKAHRGLDHFDQAYQSITDSIATVESLRTRPSNIEGGERNTYLPYLAALDLLSGRNRTGEAFDYAERAKVQTLTELLRSSNARTNKGLSSSEQSEEQRLSGAIASLELQLEREAQLRTSSEARSSKLRDELQETRAAYADLRQRMFLLHPRLKVDRGELPPLKLDEIGALISDTQTALLEYAITENNTYLFVLTADAVAAKNSKAKRSAPTISLKFYPLGIRNDELTSRVTQAEDQLATRQNNYAQSARDLYDLLIKPAGDQLTLKTRLIVVPDGILWRLPFEALQPVEDHYVIDQMQVTYAPSLTALREMRKRQSALPGVNTTLLALGNPLFSKEFTSRIQLAYGDTGMSPSARQEDEIRNVGTSYGNLKSRLLAGPSASEEQLRREADKSNILHFAAPALLDDTSPMSSFIGLSAGIAKEDDGFLQAREIMNLQTTAHLVVLSDARPRGNFAGAATLGMSWSWFVAGSNSMMMSRWEVDSPAVAQLMSQFYSLLKPGTRLSPSKGKALQQSVLSLRRSGEYQHPYYWASFAMIGDAR